MNQTTSNIETATEQGNNSEDVKREKEETRDSAKAGQAMNGTQFVFKKVKWDNQVYKAPYNSRAGVQKAMIECSDNPDIDSPMYGVSWTLQRVYLENDKKEYLTCVHKDYEHLMRYLLTDWKWKNYIEIISVSDAIVVPHYKVRTYRLRCEKDATWVFVESKVVQFYDKNKNFRCYAAASYCDLKLHIAECYERSPNEIRWFFYRDPFSRNALAINQAIIYTGTEERYVVFCTDTLEKVPDGVTLEIVWKKSC